MKIKLIIFDLDGTLVDFQFRSKEAKTEIADMLKPIGIEVPTDQPTQHILKKTQRQAPDKYETLKNRIFSIFERYEMHASNTCKIRKSVPQVLKKIGLMNMKMALVTNSSRKPALNTLNRFGIKKYFSSIVTRSDLSRLKPHGDGIKKVLDDLKIDHGSAIYVGDSIIDIKAAKDANIKMVSITGGTAQIEDMKKEGSDIIIGDIEELIGAIDRI